MSILMVLIGATIGAVIGSLFMHWLNDVAKERQQLESETPYDYALTGARSDNKRLRDELVTLRALKRTEADTERIRNEIDTILSDDGEEATESVYEPNIGMPIRDNGDGTFSPITWDILLRGNVRKDELEDEQLTEGDVERSYSHSVRQAFRDRTFVRVLCTGGMVAGEITTIAFEYGELTELQLNGVDISIPAIIEIRKGDDINGETLYRKGSR